MVPFPHSQHICNCKYVCQRVLCLLTWRHQQRVPSHCFGKLWIQGEFTRPISSVHGSFGEHLGRPKIAHESHSDVTHLCCPNLGCESPLAETLKGSLCWENLCGCMGRLVGGHWLGCMDILWYSPVAASKYYNTKRFWAIFGTENQPSKLVWLHAALLKITLDRFGFVTAKGVGDTYRLYAPIDPCCRNEVWMMTYTAALLKIIP